MVVHEGLDYFITCGFRHTRIYLLTVSSTLRTSFGVHCRTRENAATRPLHRRSVFMHRRSRPPCLTQNSVGLRWPRFPTTMLSFSWINLPNISISGLIKPHSENIVHIIGSHIYVACLTHCHIHFISTLSFATDGICVLPTPKLITFRSPFYPSFAQVPVRHSICHLVVYNLKTFPCQITAATNVMNDFCARYALSATYWSYVKRAALYWTFISQSFVRGNNSNDPVAGRVSRVVVDEGGHAMCLPSVT